MDPRLWGWVFWPLLHYFCECIDRNVHKEVFKRLVELFPSTLPCPGCKVHASLFYRERPIPDENVLEWSIDFHNHVNTTLGKTAVSKQEAYAKIELDRESVMVDHVWWYLQMICLMYEETRDPEQRLLLQETIRLLQQVLPETAENEPPYDEPVVKRAKTPEDEGFHPMWKWCVQYKNQTGVQLTDETAWYELQTMFAYVPRIIDTLRADDMRKEDAKRIETLRKALEEKGLDVDAISAQAEVEGLKERSRQQENTIRELREMVRNMRNGGDVEDDVKKLHAVDDKAGSGQAPEKPSLEEGDGHVRFASSSSSSIEIEPMYLLYAGLTILVLLLVFIYIR